MKDPESFLALRGYSDLQGEKRRHLKILFVTSLYQPQQVCRSIHIYRHTVIVLRNAIHATAKCLSKKETLLTKAQHDRSRYVFGKSLILDFD